MAYSVVRELSREHGRNASVDTVTYYCVYASQGDIPQRREFPYPQYTQSRKLADKVWRKGNKVSGGWSASL